MRAVFLLLILSEGICYFDANPPEISQIEDIRPNITFNLSGFAAGARTYIRYKSGATNIAFPSSYALYTDAAGRLQTEVSLLLDETTAEVLVYVDQNLNGQLDSADFGYYQGAIAIDPATHWNTLDIAYQTGTLTTYTSLEPLPVTGRKICVYMPPGQTPYSTAMNSNLPEYPVMGDLTLTAADWFPNTIIGTAGIVTSAVLLNSWTTPSVNEVCVPE